MVVIMIVMVIMVIMSIMVIRVASVKSSIGIFTHQGHIRLNCQSSMNRITKPCVISRRIGMR